MCCRGFGYWLFDVELKKEIFIDRAGLNVAFQIEKAIAQYIRRAWRCDLRTRLWRHPSSRFHPSMPPQQKHLSPATADRAAVSKHLLAPGPELSTHALPALPHSSFRPRASPRDL